MRPAVRTSRWAAAAVGAVLLAQLGGIAHLAFTAHVRCEHGELVEAHRIAPLPPLPAAREDGLWEGEPAVVDGDHQHCLAQLHTRAQLMVRAPALQLSGPGKGSAIAPAHQVGAARNDRYRLVPKQSPPPV
jgi:hypothetical protein